MDTDRQTDTHTRVTEIVTYPHTQMVIQVRNG